MYVSISSYQKLRHLQISLRTRYVQWCYLNCQILVVNIGSIINKFFCSNQAVSQCSEMEESKSIHVMSLGDAICVIRFCVSY